MRRVDRCSHACVCSYFVVVSFLAKRGKCGGTALLPLPYFGGPLLVPILQAYMALFDCTLVMAGPADEAVNYTFDLVAVRGSVDCCTSPPACCC